MERHNLEGEFRKAVLMAVNTGDYNPMRPQPSFIKLYGDFKEGWRVYRLGKKGKSELVILPGFSLILW